MTEKNYLSEFLLQLKGAKPGQLDISNIPAEELGDVLDTMHALFCFKKDQGITVNSMLAGSLKKDEYLSVYSSSWPESSSSMTKSPWCRW